MSPLPLIVTWGDLTLRLLVAFTASLLIGLNRGQHGEPAGLRTTILVGMAASVAMIQANVLLSTAGKETNFFAGLDPMRLPLGILTGMGFIGGGAILRRGDRILGVTTAATLWFVTVIGLCCGGGQLVLGVAATAICLAVLWALKAFEAYIPQDHRAILTLATDADGPSPDELLRRLQDDNVRVVSRSIAYAGSCRETRYDLRWRSRQVEVAPPSYLATVAEQRGVRRIEWSPVGAGDP